MLSNGKHKSSEGSNWCIQTKDLKLPLLILSLIHTINFSGRTQHFWNAKYSWKQD